MQQIKHNSQLVDCAFFPINGVQVGGVLLVQLIEELASGEPFLSCGGHIGESRGTQGWAL